MHTRLIGKALGATSLQADSSLPMRNFEKEITIMKHKKIVFLLMIMILLTFTGCAQVTIATGIDDNYDVYLSYVIKVDLTQIEARQVASTVDALDMLVKHYKDNLGFETVSSDTDSVQGLWQYSLVKTIPNDSYQQAFNTLQDMLTDEKITPFMQVDMTSKITEYQQLYSFKGELDFETIYKTTNIESFPQSVKDTINQNFQSSKGLFTLELPGSEIENASDGETFVFGESADLTTPFEFGQKTPIELSTRLNTTGEEVIKKPMESILQDLNNNLYLVIAIGIIAFITIIIGILLHSRKNNHKNNHENDNHFI